MAPVVQALRPERRPIDPPRPHGPARGPRRPRSRGPSTWTRPGPGIMREEQSLYDVATACLDRARGPHDARNPDFLLVQGDTASVFFGALAGFFEGVRVGHVEAGLRSGDLRNPFPEEGFRKAHRGPDRPPLRAHRGGGGEPPARRVYPRIGSTARGTRWSMRSSDGGVGRRPPPEALARLEARARRGPPFALLTAHRRESFGEPLRRVFKAVLRELVEPVPESRSSTRSIRTRGFGNRRRSSSGGHPRVHLVSPPGVPGPRAGAGRRPRSSPIPGGSRRRRPPSARRCSSCAR
jgi:UDP-N-acetylglucosamine 2-epimerase (non-hydrolysing)